jgi:glyoxalase family protein
MKLTGIHHVSTLSSRIRNSREFYIDVLGLRPVITTVNQDDTSMYHLFFGDGAGSPGSDITVFDIPGAAQEHRGNNSLTLTTFRVAGEGTLDYWTNRLEEFDVPHSGIITRDGRSALDFTDAVGTQLSLVDDGGQGESFPWDQSSVPPKCQIRGLGYVVLTVPLLEPTQHFLTEGLELVSSHEYPVHDAPQFSTHVYTMYHGGAHAEVHVAVRDDIPRARYGSGGVHHVALRIPEGQSQIDWVKRLDSLGYRNSGIVDRHYFQSVYVREPNHILFELATDGPGFDVDGPIDADRLSLPPFLEPRRQEIETRLVPLTGK